MLQAEAWIWSIAHELGRYLYPEGVTVALTPLVMLAVLGVPLHAVVQFHEDWLQARVHPLDQFMVHHQRPQQHAQDWTGAQTKHWQLYTAPLLHRRQSKTSQIYTESMWSTEEVWGNGVQQVTKKKIIIIHLLQSITIQAWPISSTIKCNYTIDCYYYL